MDRPSSISGTPAPTPWWKRSLQAGSTADSAATRGSFRMSHACAVATCALVPAYVVRWRLGPLPTTLLEDAILLTIVVFAAESVRHKEVLVWRTPVTVPAILFLVAGAISIVVAPDHRAALGLYRAYIVEPMAFALVLINVVSTANRATALVAGLAAGGAVAGLANAATVIQALRHHAYDVVNTPPVVIYNTANAVALYLVPLIAFAGAVALHWTGRALRLSALAFALVGGVCVLLSFSRGGYLALGVVAVGLALSHRWRWFLVAGGVAGGIVLMLVPFIGNRVLTDIDLNNPHNTLVGRFKLWSFALQMLHDHPLFGAGLSGFAATLAPYWNPTNVDRFTYPHNIVLNFWTETGLLGLAAFAWIMVAGFSRTWIGWRQAASEWRVVHLGVMLALVAVAVHGLVDVPYFKNDLSLEFWALFSLSLAPAALELPPRQAGRNPARNSGSAS